MAENNGVGGVTSQRQRGSAFAGGLQQATDPRANVPQGLPGPAGATGPAGPAGPMGAAGRDGRDGTDGRDGDSILNVTDARNNADDGSILTITFTDGRTPILVAIPDGPTGPAGPTGNGIATITGSPAVAGQPITVTVTFTDNTTATFSVPAGADGNDGAQGPQAQFGNPTSSGLPAGSNPAVSISGIGNTQFPYILDFDLPTGATGDTGPAGAQGPQGVGVDDVRATPQTANPRIIDLVFALDNPAGTDPANVTTSFRVPDTTFTPTSTGGTIDITGSNFEVDNPFTAPNETKLNALRTGTITMGTTASDGTTLYTAQQFDEAGNALPDVTWTTGGGGSGPTPPVERFVFSVNRPRVEFGNPSNFVSVGLTLGITAQSTTDGFTYTGYDGLTINGIAPAGIPASGTATSLTLPRALFGDFGTVQTYTIRARLLSTNPDGDVVTPHQATATVTVFMGSQDIYWGFVGAGARPATFALDSATDTGVDGLIGTGASASFTTVAPTTSPNSILIAYPTQAGVSLHNQFGTIVPDFTLPVGGVVDNDDAPVVPYTGVILDNITGVLRLSIER